MPAETESPPLLFTPMTLRGVTARNRVVISPMCQYSAQDGVATDWHFAHLAKFAIGGAGIVIAEATAVTAEGRITYGDLGIWSGAHADALRPIVNFIKQMGAVAGIQLAHAGRKASAERPWDGNGPLRHGQTPAHEPPWRAVAPSAEPAGLEWPVPKQLSVAAIGAIGDTFAAAARRADQAGFDLVEIHGAHGYLIHSFLSPLSNHRNDAYGQDLGGRMRFALEVAAKVRAVWPAQKPLFFRIASVDGPPDGWSLDDSVVLARELKARGVDVIDCSSGGISADSSPVAKGLPRPPGFQVPFAARIRREVGIATQAVGLITQAGQAERILQDGDADLIAIARGALFDANWPQHAAGELGADPEFLAWPRQYGWWLSRQAKASAR